MKPATNDNPNAGNSASQTRRILAYMREGNTITPLEALDLFGSMRLGARIADIEKLIGYAPSRRRVSVRNADGKEVRVCQYWLEEKA